MSGMSLRRIPAGLPGAGIPVFRLHYTADPTMTAQKVAEVRRKYTSEARFRREMEIEYESLEGELLYPQFNRERNLCDPFDVSDPEYWTIWMALDPHPRTAMGLLWEAFSKYGDSVTCGELWPEFGTKMGPTDGNRWMTRDYAEAIQFFESDSQYKPAPFLWARGKRLKVFRRVMDTFGAAANSDEGEDYFQTYLRLGRELTGDAEKRGKASERVHLYFEPALKGQNNLAKAQDSIARRLMPSAQGPPRERIFRDCYEIIDEYENVRFPEGDPERPADERPITYRKHLLDCRAYIETARPGFVMLRHAVSQPPRNAPGAR